VADPIYLGARVGVQYGLPEGPISGTVIEINGDTYRIRLEDGTIEESATRDMLILHFNDILEAGDSVAVCQNVGF